MEALSFMNKQFVRDYNSVLIQHVECILSSRMLLDEDMHLLVAFWNPNLYTNESQWVLNTLKSSAYLTAGLLVTLRLKNVYPLMYGTIPAAAYVFRTVKTSYFKRRYKNNFQKLSGVLFELYELNRSILDYYNKRDASMQAFKIPNGIYAILLKPGEDFLRCAIQIMLNILAEINDAVLKVSELVSLTEGNYVYYSIEQILDEFSTTVDNDCKELLHKFQKLCDFYMLLVSNFLSCLGLRFCVQLWKNGACNFRSIFDDVIPELIVDLNSSLDCLKVNFNNIRFTLFDKNEASRKLQKSNPGKKLAQLQQPLGNFLTNLQIVFETTKQLQLLADESAVDFEQLFPLIESIKTQLNVCDDSLNTALKVFYLLTKKAVLKKAEAAPLFVDNQTKASAEVRFDDPFDVREDEEYNLSIHGSDDEDSLPPLYDYADNCSMEHLELMLLELKRKLDERKGAKNKIEGNSNRDESPTEKPSVKQAVLPPSLNPDQPVHLSPVNILDGGEPQKNDSPKVEQQVPPLPPPPLPFLNQDLPIQQLPTLDNDRIGLLDAVKTVAQKLNRAEEVFGSDFSDSDESLK